ncbi:AAA family ATPase [Marinagarivorans algicola]|uniref:AAA family ATPase n=1 Tax=Marinagarivorans algicola TaxID=1513270 RepID=UPI0037365975
MKPLKLTVQAFGPFADEQVLDFTQLGKNPLFLINGATGAGKSTLLDAMCFALYGQTSGSDRDAAQMRCDHATHETRTQITLTFEIKGKQYTVERIPQQERNKARGEGTTLQQTEANLWLIEDNKETIITAKKANQVTQYITQLMGLTVEQFRQVMILPQGKFRDFLLADSGDREKIFSTLFQTHTYKQLEDKLKAAAKEVDSQYKLLKHDTSNLLADYEANDTDALQQYWQDQQRLLIEIEQARDTAKKDHDQQQKNLELAVNTVKEFDQLAEDQKKLDALLDQKEQFSLKKSTLKQGEQAKAIKADYNNFEFINNKTQQAQQRLTLEEQGLQQAHSAMLHAQTQLKQATIDAQNIPQQQEQLRVLAALLPKIDELHQAQANTSTATEQTLQNKQRCDALSQAIAQHEKSIDENRKTTSNLKDSLAQLPALKTERERQVQLGTRLKKRDELEQAIAGLNAQIGPLSATIEQAKNNCNHENQALQQLEYLWHSQQAAILAQQLQPNTACLVCGSTNHPKPANTTDDTLVDVAAIKQQKQVLENANAQLNTHNLVLTRLNTEHKNATKQQHEIAQLLASEAHTDIHQLREACKKITDDIKALKDVEVTLKQLAEREASWIKSLNKDQQALKEQQALLIQSEASCAVAHDRLKLLEQAIPEEQRDKALLTNNIKQLELNISALEQQQQKSQEAFDKAHTEWIQKQQLTAELKNNYDTQLAELNEAKAHWRVQLNCYGFENTDAFNNALLTAEQEYALASEITHYDQNTNDLQAIIKAQIQKLKDKTPPDIQALKTAAQTSSQRYNVQLSHWQKQQSLIDQIQSTLTKLKNIFKKSTALEEQHRLVGTLADCASGKNGKRISLQRFVLGVLLDDVLIEASERLITMSKGRYRLLRNLERTKGGGASGLDLLIEDNHTGKTRSAATLSGGESFLAALALALGLTDVVQAYAGGIQLDALFIDEGFGSLDQEALDLALHTLIDLQHSGKMIGIISHVSELKEQMALRVDITSSASGSHISLSA